jgi:hypothetical protein
MREITRKRGKMVKLERDVCGEQISQFIISEIKVQFSFGL